jgi:succinate dehydrogenase / fumarate reductase cytochrome b subunit
VRDDLGQETPDEFDRKEAVMAVTGLLLCGFLVAHVSGNYLLLSGRDAFNAYAEDLKSFGVLFYVAEVGLLELFGLHIVLAIVVTRENRRARPVPYVVYRSRGTRTFSSNKMFLSGVLILVFLLIHLWTFRFADLSGTTLYDVVMTHFQNIGYVAYYVFFSCVVAVHVAHGFQSAFKSLGLEHAKYTPWIRVVGLLFAWGVALSYSFLPIWACFLSDFSKS